MREDFESLRSQIAALEQLLDVHERVALEQSERLEDVIAQRDAALAESQGERGRLLDLLRQMPAAVSMYEGPDLVLVYSNPKAREIAGPRVEMTGKPLTEIFPEVEDQGYLEIFQQVLRTEEPFLGIEAPVEIELDETGPQERFFDYALLPMRGTTGEVQGILSFAYEVTEKVANRLEIESLAGRLKGLAEASLEINAANTADEVLRVAAEWSRELTGARRVVISIGSDKAGTGHALVSLSEEEDPAITEALRGRDPFGLDSVVAEEKAAVHLTRSQIANAMDVEPTGLLIEEWIGAPLSAHEGEQLGSIQLTDPTGSVFDVHSATLMTQLSQIVSIAIENVNTYQREHRIAETLQRSLLPEGLPRLTHFELTSVYEAGADGVSVGGDWYDAIDLRDGRIGIVLGDVVGKGIRAAVLMSQFRNAVRVFAFESSSPVEVVQRLDRLMEKMNPTYMATLIYGILDDTERTFTFTNAGHLPPVLWTPPRASLVDDAMSVPVGVDPAITREESQIELAAGSELILFTDGLVERRGGSIEDGLAALLRTIESSRASGPVAQELITEMSELGQDAEDDIAILSVRGI